MTGFGSALCGPAVTRNKSRLPILLALIIRALPERSVRPRTPCCSQSSRWAAASWPLSHVLSSFDLRRGEGEKCDGGPRHLSFGYLFGDLGGYRCSGRILPYGRISRRPDHASPGSCH